MTHISPAATLSWAIYAVVFEGFLLSHLWQYDRFRCLRWTSNKGSSQNGGAFKKIMTLTYLSNLPLLMVYSGTLAYIKYSQGFIILPGGGIHPTPWQLWPRSMQNAITPLFFIFGVSVALEFITHLEELAFWLFLLHQARKEVSWFESREFRMWLIGSILALGGLPVIVFFTKSDPLKAEAWLFFVGSLASTSTTVAFLHVLYRFPAFLRLVKDSVPDPMVYKRLKRVHRLNVTRIIFRFLFNVPLLILSSDGIRGKHSINENMFGPDFLIILSGLACIVSSAITLHIFFPVEHNPESIAEEKMQQLQQRSLYISQGSNNNVDPFCASPTFSPIPLSPTQKRFQQKLQDDEKAWNSAETSHHEHARKNSFDSDADDENENERWTMYPPPPPPPPSASVPTLALAAALTPPPQAQHKLERTESSTRLTPPSISRKSSSIRATPRHHYSLSRRPSTQSLHPYIASYTSPIELVPLPSTTDRVPIAV